MLKLGTGGLFLKGRSITLTLPPSLLSIEPFFEFFGWVRG
nr:MAG TPA: hypothetical protein [Caudoviricetes sp.]